MTRNDHFFEHLEAYLDEIDGRTPLPEVVRHAVLANLPNTPQVDPLPELTRNMTMRTSLSTPARYGLVAAAVLAAVIIGGALIYRPEVGGPAPAATAEPTPALTPAPVPTPAPSPVPDVVLGPLNPGSVRTVTIQGTSMTFTVSGAGWEAHGRPYVSKSSAGPQGAEAILYWASFPEGMSAQPCSDVIGTSVGSSAADLADAISTAPGTELVARGPSDATLGGLPALAVVVTIRSEMGCDPGYFYSWEPFPMGALWDATKPGDTIRVWIVDADGGPIFIAAATRPDVASRVEGELQQIVDSIQFE